MSEPNADSERPLAPTCGYCGCAILPGTYHERYGGRVMGTYGWCVQVTRQNDCSGAPE